MKIIVCIKQVPATTKVEIDEETGTLKRTSADSRTNPFDLFALECALRIRGQIGGTVTVLTMGPQQAESMIRDAYMMGADAAVILSDRKFAGSDAQIFRIAHYRIVDDLYEIVPALIQRIRAAKEAE